MESKRMKFTTALPSWAAPPRTQTDCTNDKGTQGQVEAEIAHVVCALSNCTLKLSNVLVKPFVINTRFNVPRPSNSETERTSHSHDHVNQHELVDVLRNLDGTRVYRGVHSLNIFHDTAATNKINLYDVRPIIEEQGS